MSVSNNDMCACCMGPFDPKTLLNGKNNHNKYIPKKQKKKFFLNTDACSEGKFGDSVKHFKTIWIVRDPV